MQAGRDSQDPASRDRAVLRSELVGSVALLPLLRLLPLGVTCITPQADRDISYIVLLDTESRLGQWQGTVYIGTLLCKVVSVLEGEE